MEELEWEKMLHIHTSGRDDSDINPLKFPYEPTPYYVLEAIAKSGYVTKKNTVLNYGSGKGRVDFFLSYETRCHSIGVEYNPRLYEQAINNLNTASSSIRVSFILEDASSYIPDKAIDRIYFFNPFSISILKDVIDNIRRSLEMSKREIIMMFYYPSDKYLEYIKSENISVIDVIDLKMADEREKVVVCTM